jgi:pimeloyl-ACP methyl ester carboxylesterase
VQLVGVSADDGRELEGLLYEGDGRPVASVLHLHGKGGNCYSGSARFIPRLTRGNGVRHLALNMRCHDLGYTRADVRYDDFQEGTARTDGGWWEQVSVGPLDVAAGVRALKECGPEPVFIAGHSSGGFYTATYCQGDPDIAGRILLSPLTDNRRPLPMWFGEGAGLAAAVERAREMVESGHGDLVLPLPTWYYGISARSLLERAAEEDLVWLTAMQASDASVLFLWGGAESRGPLWQSLSDQLSAPDKEVVVVDGADHNYVGHEEAVARAVSDFVTARAG